MKNDGQFYDTEFSGKCFGVFCFGLVLGFFSKEILDFEIVKYFVKACFKILWTDYLKAIRV